MADIVMADIVMANVVMAHIACVLPQVLQSKDAPPRAAAAAVLARDGAAPPQ